MSLLNKVKTMLFGRTPQPRKDSITPDVSRAVQRNEMAGEAARRALEELKMRNVLHEITGRMK
jgi:hypothetical protein